MPEAAVRSAWSDSIADCAETFAVSEEAMHWRLYKLGVVSEMPVRALSANTEEKIR